MQQRLRCDRDWGLGSYKGNFEAQVKHLGTSVEEVSSLLSKGVGGFVGEKRAQYGITTTPFQRAEEIRTLQTQIETQQIALQGVGADNGTTRTEQELAEISVARHDLQTALDDSQTRLRALEHQDVSEYQIRAELLSKLLSPSVSFVVDMKNLITEFSPHFFQWREELKTLEATEEARVNGLRSADKEVVKNPAFEQYKTFIKEAEEFKLRMNTAVDQTNAVIAGILAHLLNRNSESISVVPHVNPFALDGLDEFQRTVLKVFFSLSVGSDNEWYRTGDSPTITFEIFEQLSALASHLQFEKLDELAAEPVASMTALTELLLSPVAEPKK